MLRVAPPSRSVGLVAVLQRVADGDARAVDLGEQGRKRTPATLPGAVEEPGEHSDGRREQPCIDGDHVGVARASAVERIDDDVVPPRADQAARLVGTQYTTTVVDLGDPDPVARERQDPAEEQPSRRLLVLPPRVDATPEGAPVE